MVKSNCDPVLLSKQSQSLDTPETSELFYDCQNRLTKVITNNTEHIYTYDGDGGRVKVESGNYWGVYIGSLYEIDKTGKRTKNIFPDFRTGTPKIKIYL